VHKELGEYRPNFCLLLVAVSIDEVVYVRRRT